VYRPLKVFIVMSIQSLNAHIIDDNITNAIAVETNIVNLKKKLILINRKKFVRAELWPGRLAPGNIVFDSPECLYLMVIV